MPKERKATEKAEKKPRAAKKDNEPKRALSAYMFFVQDNRQTLKDENPGVSFGELGKLLGAKWKSLNDTEKEPYTKKAEDDKKRAEREREEAGLLPKSKAKPKKASSDKSASPDANDDEE